MLTEDIEVCVVFFQYYNLTYQGPLGVSNLLSQASHARQLYYRMYIKVFGMSLGADSLMVH